ncbi:hypothetical protein Zm00014a_033312 [Zea mays]|nr:hypothetical protein Zm00014a_033312 [Zea mays]
MDNSLVF